MTVPTASERPVRIQRATVAFLAAMVLLFSMAAPASAAAAPPGTIPDAALAKMLAGVGFSGDALVTALEIVWAESGANPRALNPSGARGIFQFMPNTLADDNCAYDPVCASQAAYRISKAGTDWHKWETFTTGVYARYRSRALAALSLGGVDANLIHVGLTSLDPQKVVYQAIAGLLYSMDRLVLTEIEKLWTPMVTGTDDLNGSTSLGSALVVDNSHLRNMWGISLAIATGSLLVMLFILSAVLWMLRSAIGVRHDTARNLVYFFATVILMAGSFFLVTQLIAVDNALVSAINGQVTIELRALPAYQNLGLKDPSTIQEVDQLLQAISLFLVGLFIGLELIFLFVIYFIRLILIWVLVVLAPFVLAVGILPGARGMVIYWSRLLIATVLLKFVNVLVFMTFVLMGATSAAGLFNELLVLTMLLFMILVPGLLFRAMAEPHLAIASAQETWSRTTNYAPLRAAGGQLLSRLRRS
ncbi:transglycosylase SLT domain-containing protein [Candidatus Nephthysia bennettiae]|uniref:Transglycosylase SLT domain-containing protein n=1 Tax=Candidatus Nephthysia bennettiae TaxID=3127016 RepID=A0A934KBK4_9BACT|nr:transglycosylase SLT domain-containing protein [Candidatus Dormibacteraeota bacterium]